MKVVSVDGGATKTFAIYYDTEAEEVLGVGIAGPSNYFSVSIETAANNIRKAIDMATSLRRTDDYDLVLGIAGYGDSPKANDIGRGLAKTVAGNRIFYIENDGVFAYRMANLFHDGLIFAPGTGSIGIYQKENHLNRIGGWGWFAGDEGSASWIAKRAITLSEEQYDGLIAGDSLIRAVEQHFGNDFIQAINDLEGDHPKRKVALMAPRISMLAYKGDAIAKKILDEAGEYDARILKRMTEFFDHQVDVALVGGTVMAGRILTDTVKRLIENQTLRLFYGYHVAVGGIIMFLNNMKIQFDTNLRDSIVSQTDRAIMDLDVTALPDYIEILKLTKPP
ncbi:hypothetical protein DMB44_03525 [Thermoplasma sp. Kam2015]|uniref:BadF/BadG/BcrA/BcrD ATPase family protein n=1 Tax=Thermoplasma sp. Kam2015 TaxID=2094122 RepID=UPI000D8B95B4|nr:BadF/BadG/BcrA/BcrD ATPase family protein [Thermoplasma sp. Kam2015]PYB68423.1 hypothetical protein DMB44_03525 [Thermoplasma sp. Kam2015]